MELCYIRDKEKREVDFAVVCDGKLVELYEAKSSDELPSTSLRYFAERLKPWRAVQVILHGRERGWKQGKLEVVNAKTLFTPRWGAVPPTSS